VESRDDLAKGYLKELNILANSMIYEFNRVQSTGQGLARFSQLTSLHGVDSSSDVLAIDGSITSGVVQNTIVDQTLIGFPDLTGRRIFMLDGDAALESREITGFDPTTGTIVLDEEFNNPPNLGDRYQITDLSFPIQNGSFDLVVTNEATGSQDVYNITIDLDKSLGAGPTITDETLDSIVAQLNATSPFVAASVTAENKLEITSNSPEIKFSFAQDTSGFLGAIGMNSMFEGVDAGSIKVNEDLLRNPSLLSVAQSNSPGDNSNAIAFSALRSTSVFEAETFEELYQNLVGRLGVQTAETQNRLENQTLVQQQLENQRERVSGVNIDEEAVKMLQFQRAYQASARFIGVVDSLMETLLGAV
jgi:flagellar hook-associated protein FlgK